MAAQAPTRYSLNQIEHTVRKAARGAGLSWGVAEDAGRAARWLHMIEIPGVTLFAPALLGITDTDGEAKRVRQRKADDAITTLSATGVELSPLVVGPCIVDWVNGLAAKPGPKEAEIAVENVTHPLVLAGYCGVAAQQTRRPVLIRWQGFQMHCTSSGARLFGEQRLSPFQKNVQVLIADSDGTHSNDRVTDKTVRIGSVDIDAQAWQKLQVLTQRTYVEASDSSRLAGAGAGLNDND